MALLPPPPTPGSGTDADIPKSSRKSYTLRVRRSISVDVPSITVIYPYPWLDTQSLDGWGGRLCVVPYLERFCLIFIRVLIKRCRS